MEWPQVLRPEGIVKTKTMPKTSPALTRVAVYTRKSTTDGLEQDFNSLDNQRQAIEAYITSQRSEGWIALPDRYDDGGFTGANTDRPAFQRLVSDIEAGKIDVVAVYKLDRLSRSIGDFVGLMRLFEKHGVTFVSVTQNFSTTNAVGRMTMNLLATFAEFERETISERTRDKMSAARRRGMWTGGHVPLGFDVVDKKLVVNKGEAEQVRAIYAMYLEHGSILATVAELARRGWTTKSWITADGNRVRGCAFGKENLRRMLRNPVYIGRMALGKESFEAQHERIIDAKVWNAVQAQLGQRLKPTVLNTKSGAILSGLLHCKSCGSPMRHSFAQKDGRRWSYYVCSRALEYGAASCPKSRVQREQVEQYVVDQIRRVGRDPKVVAAAIDAAKRDREARKPELLAESRRIQNDRARLEGERRNMLDAVGAGGVAVQPLLARVAEIDEQIQKLDARQAEVRGELARDGGVDEDALRRALAEFDGLWNELVTHERIRLLRLVVGEIRFDGNSRQIEIDLLQAGAQRGAA